MGRLVNQGRHAIHTASLDQLPETARLPGPDNPLGGKETITLAKDRYVSLQGEGAPACVRTRPTHSLRVIPATEFVGIGTSFMRIEKHVTVRCPCCDSTDVDTRHSRIWPRAGAQAIQHQPLLHAISRTLKQLGVPHVETGEPLTADRTSRWTSSLGEEAFGTPQTRNAGTSLFSSR